VLDDGAVDDVFVGGLRGLAGLDGGLFDERFEDGFLGCEVSNVLEKRP
jgi:hypothetical protein